MAIDSPAVRFLAPGDTFPASKWRRPLRMSFGYGSMSQWQIIRQIEESQR
jgi:hypothetical protein